MSDKTCLLKGNMAAVVEKINIPVPDTGSCLLMDVRAIRLQEENRRKKTKKPTAPVNKKHSDVATVVPVSVSGSGLAVRWGGSGEILQ